MASTNQSPFYKQAEVKFLLATTPEEKIECLEIMIKECPKHKSSENMLQNLTRRKKKLKQSLEKSKKSGKGKNQGIKKAEIQAIVVGFPNTGKSSLFNLLTNQNSKVSPAPFTTYEPKLGTTIYQNSKIQIIDSQPFPSHDKSLINSTDTLLLVIDNLSQLKESQQFLNISPLARDSLLTKEEDITRVNREKNANKVSNLKTRERSSPISKQKLIIIYNKEDLLDEQEKRKIEETLKSKKLNFFLISSIKPDKNKIEQLKEQIFNTFPVIRIYTKEPHKPATKEPMLLKQNATVEDVAEKILKGMSKKIKRTKIWGPSSKFSGQIVGLEHKLKDKDTVEFQTE